MSKEQDQNMIGTRIRERRQELGISLQALAGQVGLTASFLSQVERDLASPSLQSLKSIAGALQVPVFFFLLDESNGGYVVRRDHRKRLPLPDLQLKYELLTPDVDRRMLLFVGHYLPGGRSRAISAKPGVEECIYIMRGCMEIELADGVYILSAGDSIYFTGPELRQIACCGEEELVYLSISTPPAF